MKKIDPDELVEELRHQVKDSALRMWQETHEPDRLELVLKAFVQTLYAKGYVVFLEGESEPLREKLLQLKQKHGLHAALTKTLTQGYKNSSPEELRATWYNLLKSSSRDLRVFGNVLQEMDDK